MTSRMVCAAFAAMLLATPAAAEPMRLAQGGPYDVVPPFEVITIVRSTGLRPLERPMRRGPNYVLHAIGRDGREVRVIVDAHYGDILSVAPVMSAARTVPGPGYGARPGMRPQPHVDPDDDDDAPDGYVRMDPAPGAYRGMPPGAYRDAPPDEYEPMPPGYGRPRAPMPQAAAPLPRNAEPPPVIQATPPGAYDYRAPMEPRVSAAPPPADGSGLLPPPPDRFPQRAAPPAAGPPPVKRSAAAPPKAPLPKPRPDARPAEVDAAPLPPPVPERQPDVGALPH